MNVSGIVACPPPLEPTECYLAGDLRVNEQSALTVMHTIWVREHNRIAMALKTINPNWGEERLFQETRQIVGAQIQKITYKDYLPLLIGDQLPELILDYSVQGYNNEVNPNIPNAFATAAYRYGHSQIQPFFDRLDENYNSLPQGPLNLVDAFFTPSRFVESGGTDPILRGLVTKRARFVDEFLNNLLTNHLFAANNATPGLDLASLNIQRGRDHGLPPYLTWKRWALEQCGIESDFRNELTKIRFLQTYGNLETVDLFVAGLSEEPLKGGLVGATFACIFARTFQAVRDGDRFYYENDNQTTGIFTAAQRAEIEKASLSRVICDNSDNIQTIQRNAFLADQERVSCDLLPQINLNAWQETPLCYVRIGVSDKSGQSNRFAAISAFSDESTYHYSQERVRSTESSGCLSIRCPQQLRPSNIGIFPVSSTCSLSSNSNLPTSNLAALGFYVVALDISHVSDSNGVYNSESSCSAGPVNAVSFTCGGLKGEKQSGDKKMVQALEQMLNTQQNSESVTEKERIDKEIGVNNPLFTTVPEEVQKFIKQTAGSPSTGKSNQKLISVMESVLKELKAQKNNKEADDQLVAELSEALERI